ncbi:hypothetical protein IEQ34_008293 [Dendrobium chrysotoxum]|uniref:Uncharacterized protein n=1 Tax=Dendrobium chrysotoxum TaxID=161865 RepID=A0AAV7H3Q4_DENCH|nr:hypothetical protein IEQ34_008293 [Dendrobium chrysotoxum]
MKFWCQLEVRQKFGDEHKFSDGRKSSDGHKVSSSSPNKSLYSFAFALNTFPSSSTITNLRLFAISSPVNDTSSFLGTSKPIPFSTSFLAISPLSTTISNSTIANPNANPSTTELHPVCVKRPQMEG